MSRDHIDVQQKLKDYRNNLELQAEFFRQDREYEQTKSQEITTSTATSDTVSISNVVRIIYYIGLVTMFGLGLDMYVNNEDDSNRKRTGLILWVFPLADRALWLLLYCCGCRGNKK